MTLLLLIVRHCKYSVETQMALKASLRLMECWWNIRSLTTLQQARPGAPEHSVLLLLLLLQLLWLLRRGEPWNHHLPQSLLLLHGGGLGHLLLHLGSLGWRLAAGQPWHLSHDHLGEAGQPGACLAGAHLLGLPRLPGLPCL